MINKCISSLKDELLEKYLQEISLEATTRTDVAYVVDEYIIVATTNYDKLTNKFDTRSGEAVISEVLEVNQ